jgi:hypothetical protein
MFCDTTKVSFILPRIQTFILEPRILRCNTSGFEKWWVPSFTTWENPYGPKWYGYDDPSASKREAWRTKTGTRGGELKLIRILLQELCLCAKFNPRALLLSMSKSHKPTHDKSDLGRDQGVVKGTTEAKPNWDTTVKQNRSSTFLHESSGSRRFQQCRSSAQPYPVGQNSKNFFKT